MRRLVAWLSLCVLAGCSGEPNERVETRAASELGRELFSSTTISASTLNRFTCATCHLSEQASSDGRIRPGFPLAGAVERPTFWGGQVDSLLEAINACRYYFMGATTPWNGQEREAQALYAYLANLPPEAPDTQPFSLVLSAKDIPPGDATRGQDIYRRACGYCHGDAFSGEGRLDTATPILPDEPAKAFRETYGFSALQTRVAFIEKVRHGAFLGLYGRMPPYTLETLTDEDLSALLAYLNLVP